MHYIRENRFTSLIYLKISDSCICRTVILVSSINGDIFKFSGRILN